MTNVAPSPVRPRRPVALFLLPLLLAACMQDPPGPPDLTGNASLGGVVVQGEGQPGLPGSVVSLYLPGDHSQAVRQTQTGAGGEFSFADLAARRYDLGFSESGSAASELLGAAAVVGVTPSYPVQQRPLRDPGGVLSVPQLVVTRPNTAQHAAQPLSTSSNAFTDHLNLEVKTAPASMHQRPLQRFEVSLMETGEDGSFAELHPVGGQITPPPVPDAADSGPLSLGVGPLSGDALVQVAATEFNNNRVAVLYPVTVAGAVGGPVSAPESVRAVAYTWAGVGADAGARAQSLKMQGLKVQALAVPVLNVRVQVSWTMPALAGVRGFEVWRAGSAAGPWTRAVLAGPENCTGSVCTVPDTSAALKTGQDYFYRVAALGSNSANSALSNLPDTHVLPLIQPAVVSPAAGQTGLPLAPVYTVKSPLEAPGASGALLSLSVNDDLLGSNTPWQVGVLLRRVYGQAGQLGGQADHQVLLSRGGRYEQVYSDLAPANNLGGVKYDAASEQLSLTHNLDASGQRLQPVRRYRLALGRAAAFRLQDPSRPPGALNPLVAYSVYSDPAGGGAQACPTQPLIPGGPCLDAAPSLEFSTGAGP